MYYNNLNLSNLFNLIIIIKKFNKENDKSKFKTLIN